MKIRVRNGKRNKERYTLLSQKNLEILRVYWKNLGIKITLQMIIYLYQANIEKVN